MDTEYKIGQAVLYIKGKDHVELGIISSFNNVGEPFVRYHTGSTAACTPLHMLQPIANDYAFQIIRKDVNNEIQLQKARRMACHIIETVIEPAYGDSCGEAYYKLEDGITDTIEEFKE